MGEGEAVTCGEVVCGVMFVCLNINFVHTIVTSRTLHFT